MKSPLIVINKRIIDLLFLSLSASLFAQSTIDTWEHYEADTQYAKLAIQAKGDKDSIAHSLENILPWIKKFNLSYSYEGPLDSLLFLAKVGQTIKLDPLTTELLRFGEKAYDRTDQGIDVGIGNLLRAWKIGWGQDSQLPSQQKIDSLVLQLKTFPYHIDEAGELTVLQSGRHIAMGSYLEARILNEISQKLLGAKVQDYLIEFGGDFSFSGKNSKGSPWRIGIKRPDHPDSLLTYIDVNSTKFKGLSTSGSYEQTFIDSLGVRHHHIFDPRTGQSSQGNLSVTVLSENPLENDLFDTWYMMLPLDKIKEHIKNSPEKLGAIVVTDSNTVWVSDNLKSTIGPLAKPFQWADQ